MTELNKGKQMINWAAHSATVTHSSPATSNENERTDNTCCLRREHTAKWVTMLSEFEATKIDAVRINREWWNGACLKKSNDDKSCRAFSGVTGSLLRSQRAIDIQALYHMRFFHAILRASFILRCKYLCVHLYVAIICHYFWSWNSYRICFTWAELMVEESKQ